MPFVTIQKPDGKRVNQTLDRVLDRNKRRYIEKHTALWSWDEMCTSNFENSGAHFWIHIRSCIINGQKRTLQECGGCSFIIIIIEPICNEFWGDYYGNRSFICKSRTRIRTIPGEGDTEWTLRSIFCEVLYFWDFDIFGLRMPKTLIIIFIVWTLLLGLLVKNPIINWNS